MEKLPTQLKWAQFQSVLKRLGYQPSRSLAGAGRTFISKTREPREVSFHEPHKGTTIPNGTLSEYLRKLEIDRPNFFALLRKETEIETTESPEDRFRRYTDGNGVTTSMCSKCFGTVVQSEHLGDIEAAEALHPCFSQPSPPVDSN